MTQETRHTPGPWTIEPYTRMDKEITILEPRCMVDNDDVSPPETTANAKLIAAAPDMLAELKRLHARHGEQATADIIEKATA